MKNSGSSFGGRSEPQKSLMHSMSDAPPLKSSGRNADQVQAFIERVRERAMVTHAKKRQDELTLMEMLNAFDSLVAQENLKNRANEASPIQTPNGNEIHNQAYRLILKTERERAYQSIQDISQEIRSIKTEAANDAKVARTRNIRQNQDFNMFEFQGSFGGDELPQKLHESSTKKSNQRLVLPKISLDSVLDLQKSESFVNRCQKLSTIEKQQVGKKKEASHKKGIPHRSRSYFSPSKVAINKDITGVLTSPQSSSNKSPAQQRRSYSRSPLNQQRSTSGKRSTSKKKLVPRELERSKLPKLNLSNLVEEMGKQQDRAIDSNRAIAFAYYTRRLMLAGWRSFFNYRLEQANKRFYERICRQKRWKNLMRSGFKGLLQNRKCHKGHALANKQAQAMHFRKLGMRVLSQWYEGYYTVMEEKEKLQNSQRVLTRLKSYQLLKGWRNAILKQQLKDVQEKTASHIFKQRYMKLGLIGLKLVSDFRIYRKRLAHLSKSHENERVLRKTFSSFKILKFMKLKRQQMETIADKLHLYNIEKKAYQILQTNCALKQRNKSLKVVAVQFNSTVLSRIGFALMKCHAKISKQIRLQNNFVMKIYEKKLKQKLLRFIRQSNKEFRRKADRVEMYMRRERLEMLILNFIHTYSQIKHIQPLKAKISHAYKIYLAFFKSKHAYQIAQKNKYGLKLTKRPYYNELNQSINQKLHLFVFSEVFSAWKGDFIKVKNFKQKLKEKFMYAFLRALQIKARKNRSYRYSLANFIARKKDQAIQRSFDKLKTYKFKRAYETLIVKKFKEMRESQSQRDTLIKWALLYKQKSVKTNQKLIALEIATKKRLEARFHQWHKAFICHQRKRAMKEAGDHFMRFKLQSKYMNKILSTYYSIHKLEQLLQNHKKKIKTRMLKKSLCGFLQNVLVRSQNFERARRSHKFRELTLYQKSLVAWRHQLPELKQRNTLVRMIKSERSVKLAAKCIQCFRTYLLYKIQKQQTDHFMGKAILQVTSKRFFSQWRNHLRRRTACKLLEHVSSKVRSREFFSRVENKAEFEDSLQRHMALFNAFKLLEFTFKRGFQRNVDLKYIYCDNTELMKQISLRQTKRHYLNQWLRGAQRNQWEVKMAQFCIVKIKNVVLQRYFHVLKAQYEWKQLKNKVLRSKVKSKKQGVWGALKITCRKLKHCREVLESMNKAKRIQELTLHLKEWRKELYYKFRISQSFQKSQKRLMAEGFNQWKFYQLIIVEETERITQIQQLRAINSVRQAYATLRNYYCRQNHLAQSFQTIQDKSQQLLKANYFVALRDRYSDQKEEIEKFVYIKRKVYKRVIIQKFNLWTMRAEETLTRVRVARGLNQLISKIEMRVSLKKLISYSDHIGKLEHASMQIYEQKQKEAKKQAVLKMRNFRIIRVVERERKNWVTQYYKRKWHLKLFTIMQFATKLLVKRKINKLRGGKFRQWNLMKKSLHSLAGYVRQSKTIMMSTYKMKETLRKRQGPKVLNLLKFNYLTQNECRVKEQFAQQFRDARLYQKIFKELYWSMVKIKDKKYCLNRAVSFCNQRHFRTCFYAILNRTTYERIRACKRQALMCVIESADRRRVLSDAFAALSLNRVEEQEKIGYVKLQMMLNQMQRIIDAFRFYNNFKKSLRDRMHILQDQATYNRMRTTLHGWIHRLNIENKTKMLQQKKMRMLKAIAFAGLLRQRGVKQLVQLSLKSKVISYLKISFQALQNNSLNNKRLRIIEQQLKLKQLINTVQKTFMGLHYERIIQKNHRLMQYKLKNSLMLRSFSGWKYQIVLDKTRTSFVQLRKQRDISFFFNHWLDTQRYLSSRKNAVHRVALKKHFTEESQAFFLWKQKCFHVKFMQLLQEAYLVPHHRNIAARCIQSWRKFARYRKNKQEIFERAWSISASLAARRCLREWFELATSDGGETMRIRILFKRLSEIIDKKRIHNAFTRIQIFGERKQYIEENLLEFKLSTQMARAIHYFSEWRKRFSHRVLSKEAVMQNKRKLVGDTFAAMIAHSNYSKVKKDIVTQTSQAVIEATSLETRLIMIDSILSRDMKLNWKSQKEFFFFHLIRGLNQQRIEKAKVAKALQFQKYKLYLKYFYGIINFVANCLLKNQQLQKAKEQYRYNSGVKLLKGLVVHTLKRRKLHSAEAFYNSRICTKALYNLYNYQQERQGRAVLKSRMMHLLKKKCSIIFKAAFFKWRSTFNSRQYARAAIEEFDKFREAKLKRIAFGGLIAVINQQRQITDMARKAYAYFYQRKKLRLMYKALSILKNHAKRQQRSKTDLVDMDLQALRFYAYNLQARHIRSWRKEVLANKKKQTRSKLYAIFSAWKFYIKERSLLKMYLRECNGLDPSLMSTGELKENYARASSNTKGAGIFAESVSSGTPFRQREALSPIEGGHNMSPHFSKLTESQLKRPSLFNYNNENVAKDFDYGENDEDSVDLQATGNFSSIGSKTGNFMTQQPAAARARLNRF